MSGYGDDGSADGPYGYGYGGYGYVVQLGPSYYGLDFLSGRLDGPGSSAYADFGHGTTGYIHESDNGGIFQQVYSHHGNYVKIDTTYSYSRGGYSYYSHSDFVSDPAGLPFDNAYQEPFSATAGEFSNTRTTSYGDTTSINSNYYSYSDGSYGLYYSSHSYERGDNGNIVPGIGTSYHASMFYDASTGDLTSYHTS